MGVYYMNKFRALAVALLSIAGGILYRMGGAAGYNTKYRDFGIPTCMVLLMLAFGQWQPLSLLGLFLSFGAVFGAQTSYFKRKGENAKWFNWLLTGIAYSLAMFPLVLAQSFANISGLHTHWLGFGIRTFVCSGLTVLVSQVFGNVVFEENSRGIVEILTLPLLFI